MKYLRGDVLLVDSPFLNRPGSKIRPMVVVQTDLNNTRLNNAIFAAITSNISRSFEPTQVLIDIATPAGRASGLLSSSVVSCENILTLNQTRIVKKIGVVSPALMKLVDIALKHSLALP